MVNELPLAFRWSYYTKVNVFRETDGYGVYELGNDREILYIGEGHACSRLMTHFPDSSEPVFGASYYRVEYTGSKERAEQRQNVELEGYRRQHGAYPRFNSRKA